MKIRMTIIAAGLALTGATLAHAEDAEKAVIDDGFAKMDADKDGSISRPEFDTYVKGYIAQQKTDFDKQFAQMDADGNGKISPEESKVNAGLEVYFEQIDENSDGFVTKEEIASAMKAAQQATASN